MEDAMEKENVSPNVLDYASPVKASSPIKKGRSGLRSQSLGAGGLEDIKDDAKKEKEKSEMRNRRKSTFVSTTKSIISADAEKAARQAARRKTLANRRVSFAPEATLHTWDVIEFMRDHTTSTESSETTRRGSALSHGDQSPTSSSPASAPSRLGDDEDDSLLSPEQPRQKQNRRSSGIPPMNFNNPDDLYSSSGVSGSSDASESEGEESEGSDDETGTAMSLDVGEDTIRSGVSVSSSGSSAQLDAVLRQAAQTAGTRGIHYDEFGEEDASMELAGDTVTNAFKPWIQRIQGNEALEDQENVNPFLAEYKPHAGAESRPETIEEEDTGDVSMDVTRAVGGIMKAESGADAEQSSPFGDQTMDMTRAVGKIHGGDNESSASRSGVKRTRSTSESGSPGVTNDDTRRKRRRSSAARSSMGDEAMDLTVAVGGIQKTSSVSRPTRRRSVARRRSSAVASDQGDATMDFTHAVGGIRNPPEVTVSSIDENEELTMEAMELTTAVGLIKRSEPLISSPPKFEPSPETKPATPQQQTPIAEVVNTTPTDQGRFRDVPSPGPGKLLTPILQKQILLSPEKAKSSPVRHVAGTVTSRTRRATAFAGLNQVNEDVRPTTPLSKIGSSPPKPVSEAKVDSLYPELPEALVIAATPQQSPLAKMTPSRPSRTPKNATPSSASTKLQLDAQLKNFESSPGATMDAQKSPSRAVATPQKPGPSPQQTRSMVDSIRTMNTPRKEMLKMATPNKRTATSPPKTVTPHRPFTNDSAKSARSKAPKSPEQSLQIEETDGPSERIHLQEFLDIAGIRFMDLTATNRRMTAAPTPSKARQSAGEAGEHTSSLTLERAVVAASCTTPELEMFRHACHELKRYIKEGKQAIRQLEEVTYENPPPLIRAYQQAKGIRRAEFDAHMREMKTHARLKSREGWYGWRASLTEDLMKPLADVGEGLLKDDEYITQAETVLQEVLPPLVELSEQLQLEAGQLELEIAAMPEEDREELDGTRRRLVEVDTTLLEKQQLLKQLEQEAEEYETTADDLTSTKDELVGAIREADRVREACRGVPLDEIAKLKENIKNIKETFGWSITSATTSPTTVTMTYKSELQLFFHPQAFEQVNGAAQARPNAPISLTYVAHDRNERPKELTTTLRFFLQSLRASLHGFEQCSTRVVNLLNLVSNGWDTALSVAECERRLAIEGLTTSRIVNDDHLSVDCDILLKKVKTKVRASFGLLAWTGVDLKLTTNLDANVKVVYGQPYDETAMTKYLEDRFSGGLEGWDEAVRDLKVKLVLQGPAKSART